MSEGYAEPPPDEGSSGLFTPRNLIIVAVVAVAAYLLFFRNKSGGTSSGGGGTSQTGDVAFTPGTTNITITDTRPVPVPAPKPRPPQPHQKHRTPNPQPRPVPRPRRKTVHGSVMHPGGPEVFATVGKWTAGSAPWNSTLGGIAKRYNTSVANLLKLNPWIRNPNLIHPGERIRVK